MQRRLLRVEPLEPRLMMSGNVTVTVQGQYPLYDLKIMGDSASNQIQLSYNESQRTWTVAGLEGTLINGQQGPYTTSNVTNSVWIDMKGGNDVVKLLTFRVPNDLHVDLGAGHDRLEVGDAEGWHLVGDNMWIEGDDGNDTVTVAHLQVGHDLFVKLGYGNDTFRAGNPQGTWNAQVDAYFRIDGDSGDDQVYLDHVITNDLTAWLVGGNDYFHAYKVQVAREFTLIMGTGNDRAEIYECSASVAELNGGVGYDLLYLGGNRFGRLKLAGWENRR